MVADGRPRAIIAIYDITGIQEYIFATTRMRENAGASLIVTRMLRQTLPKLIEDRWKERAVVDWEAASSFELRSNADIAAEIIYIGGGNAIVAFRTQEDYDEVNRLFAEELVKETYTLHLATAAVATTFENYSNDKRALEEKLRRVKARMIRPRATGALPVVEQELFNGLPVTHCAKGESISTLQMLKREAYRAYDADVVNLIYGGRLPEGVKFAVEMDDLAAKKGENAFVAVVHIDGNDMGASIRKKEKALADYDSAAPEIRRLSKEISRLFRGVFHRLTEILIAAERNNAANDLTLPLRPLIMDGDDLTFVCKGALGVPMAAMFLRILAKDPANALGCSACAGVALVRQNFPFHIAYEIAEACCQNAKKKRRQKSDAAGYFDFHLVEGAYVSSLQDLRAQEAAANGARRMNRPYQVAARPEESARDSFDCLQSTMRKLAAEDRGKPRWPRNRLHKLYEAYLQGETALRALRMEFASRGYFVEELEPPPEPQQPKYQIFDALELLELYDAAFVDLCAKNMERRTKR